MEHIFSGENSRPLWDKINQVKDINSHHTDLEETVWEALYALGCKCQELESLLIKQLNIKKS